jgi:hypothetical protein
VIDALKGERAASVSLFEAVRAGRIDVAFATRLDDELQSSTLDDLARLLGDTGVLVATPWRLDYGTLGVDTILGGGAGEISLPTLEPVGKLGALDSDHLEAHRRSSRDVFVTSDQNQLKAARERGIHAVTPQELVARLGGAS